ncbi:MAG: hypothetical protein ABW128_06830 [Rhizorhabdus sp.]
MRKFELLSRASLAHMLGAAAGTTVVVAEGETPADPTPPEGDPPAGDPPAAPKPPETPTPPEDGEVGEEGAEASAQVVTVADAKHTALDAAANARKAEGARWSSVFASAEALADPSLAAFMLTHSPDASAEAVIGQLKTRAGTTGAKPAASIPDTNIDLGRGDPQAAISDGGVEAGGGDDAWAASNKRVFGSLPTGMKVGAGDAGAGYGAITSGGSLSHTPAAQRSTGN